jgi:hypothetical protein
MAPPQQDAPPPAGEIIEPDDGIPGTIDDLNYEAQKQYWFRMCPGGVLIPPPLSPYPEHHFAFLQSHSPSFALFSQQQGPPVDGAPIHEEMATGYHYQATQADGTPGTAAELPAEGTQLGVPHPSQSPASTTTASSTPSEKTPVTLPPGPTPDGRKRYGKPSPLAVLLRPHGPCQMNLLTRLQRCGP